MLDIQRFGTYNAVLPKKGPVVFPVTLDHTQFDTFALDLQLQKEQGFVDFLSGFFIDNRLNADEINVACSLTNQVIGIPAGKQAYMPMFLTDTLVIETRTTAVNGLLIPFYLTNFPVTPCVW